MSVAARAASIVLRPAFDPLASDARSQDLLRRMGLPDLKADKCQRHSGRMDYQTSCSNFRSCARAPYFLAVKGGRWGRYHKVIGHCRRYSLRGEGAVGRSIVERLA
jgi:hypothetical protein